MSDNFSGKVVEGEGGVKLVWLGDAVNNYISDLCINMAWLAGQALARQSVKNVPVLTGTLRRSARVTLNELPDAAEIYAAASAGGPRTDPSLSDATEAPKTIRTTTPKVFVSYNTPYAIKKHEDTVSGNTSVTHREDSDGGGGANNRGIKLEKYNAAATSTKDQKQLKYRQRRRNSRPGERQKHAKWLENAVPCVQTRWAHYLARAMRRVGKVNVWRLGQ